MYKVISDFPNGDLPHINMYTNILKYALVFIPPNLLYFTNKPKNRKTK